MVCHLGCATRLGRTHAHALTSVGLFRCVGAIFDVPAQSLDVRAWLGMAALAFAARSVGESVNLPVAGAIDVNSNGRVVGGFWKKTKDISDPPMTLKHPSSTPSIWQPKNLALSEEWQRILNASGACAWALLPPTQLREFLGRPE